MIKFSFKPTTGRIVTSPGLTIPTGIAGGMGVVEAPPIQYQLGTTFAKVTNQPAGKYAQVPLELAKKMKLFQLPNNLPVHIRGGRTDVVLYGATLLVCALGLMDMTRLLYVLSYPKAPPKEE